MQSVLSRVLVAIKPSQQEMEDELTFAGLLVDHVRCNVPAGCEVMLVGSMAKRTFLREKRDIDIFVLFDRNVDRGELEPAVKGIMASAFPSVGYQLSYAEHPYIRFRFEGRRVDLVPAYKIRHADERLSAVDRSALHTKFVIRSLAEGQVDDVLLLKQFLRANGLYGAEIRVEGFSGYLCELLIIKYGSFPGLAKAAAKWKWPVFIDLLSVYDAKGRAEAQERLGQFVVIDPTDRNRNVAAAVSPANARRFVRLCRDFIRKPSPELFLRRQPTFEERLARAARGRTAFMLSMPRPEVVDDVLWGQLRKLAGQLGERLADFGPLDIIADDSHHIIRLGVPLSTDTLPPTVLLEGPPLKMAKHAAEFRKIHRRAKFTVKKGRLYAEEKRQITRAEAAITAFFRSFAGTKSHLAYPEEMVVLARVAGKPPGKRLRPPASSPRAAKRKTSKPRTSKKPARSAKRAKLRKGRRRR